jgi:hypothetical protein
MQDPQQDLLVHLACLPQVSFGHHRSWWSVHRRFAQQMRLDKGPGISALSISTTTKTTQKLIETEGVRTDLSSPFAFLYKNRRLLSANTVNSTQLSSESLSKSWDSKYTMTIVIAAEPMLLRCQGRAQGYWIRRALASARALCPFPKYCPVFHKG